MLSLRRATRFLLLFLCVLLAVPCFAINICAIGDSITRGYRSSPLGLSPVTIMAHDLNAYTGTGAYAAVVHAVGGTTSGDWADTSPGSYLNSAITHFHSAGG